MPIRNHSGKLRALAFMPETGLLADCRPVCRALPDRLVVVSALLAGRCARNADPRPSGIPRSPHSPVSPAHPIA